MVGWIVRVSAVLGASAVVSAMATAPVSAAPDVSLSDAPTWSSDAVQRVGGIAFGDANRDGVLDLAIGTYAGGSAPAPLTTQVFLGQEGATESSATWISDEEVHTSSIGWGIFGGDEPRLVIINGGVGGAPPAQYGGNGMLETAATWVGVNGAEGSGLDYAIGDVNGDGVTDLFISNQCPNPCPAAPNVGYVSADGALPSDATWHSTNLGQFAGIALVDMDGSHVVQKVYTATGDGSRQVFWLPALPVHGIFRVLVDGADPGPLSFDLRTGYVQLAQAPASGAEVEIIYEASTAPDLLVAQRPRRDRHLRKRRERDLNGTDLGSWIRDLLLQSHPPDRRQPGWLARYRCRGQPRCGHRRLSQRWQRTIDDSLVEL